MGFIDTRLNKFSLPKVIYNDMDYYIELDKYLQRYIEYIENNLLKFGFLFITKSVINLNN